MGSITSKVDEADDTEIEPLYDDCNSSEKYLADVLDEIESESDESEFHVYKRRFYILAVYSFASILQVILWNTWAPITETDWNQSDIALLSMWGGIISALFCIPFAGIMDKFGIRKMFLLAETLALIGAVIRCFPVRPEHLKWTANFGQFFIALAGPFLVQGPPLVSATWFPPHQRSTATTVASTSMILGVAVSFIIGPLMVGNIKPDDHALLQNQTFQSSVDKWTTDGLSTAVKQARIDEIYHMLYIECGAMAWIYVVAWIYFPAKPPTPPCRSASKEREDFIPGAMKLIRSFNAFWLPALAYGISIGISTTWLTQLVVMFHGTVGLNQNTVSWITFYTYIGGVIGAFVSSRFVDYLGGKMKLVILSLLTPAIVCFLWFLVMIYEAIPFKFASLYASTITYGLLLKSTRPIYFDMICEGVYPIGEGITTGALNWLSNVIGLLYLVVMAIPNIGVFWMNWTVLGSIVAAFLLLVVFKEENKRLAADKGIPGITF